MIVKDVAQVGEAQVITRSYPKISSGEHGFRA